MIHVRTLVSPLREVEEPVSIRQKNYSDKQRNILLLSIRIMSCLSWAWSVMRGLPSSAADAGARQTKMPNGHVRSAVGWWRVGRRVDCR